MTGVGTVFAIGQHLRETKVSKLNRHLGEAKLDAVVVLDIAHPPASPR